MIERLAWCSGHLIKDLNLLHKYSFSRDISLRISRVVQPHPFLPFSKGFHVSVGVLVLNKKHLPYISLIAEA
jgi:hypothetical protein